MVNWGIRAAFVCALASLVGLAWGYQNGLGSSRGRTELEHGIHLPPSAHEFQCKGDAWGGFLVLGARALFLIDVSDLPSLLKELDIQEQNLLLDSSDGDVEQASLTSATPTRGGFRQSWAGVAEPLGNIVCASPRGDSLDVELWQVRDNLVAVNLHTDWN